MPKKQHSRAAAVETSSEEEYSSDDSWFLKNKTTRKKIPGQAEDLYEEDLEGITDGFNNLAKVVAASDDASSATPKTPPALDKDAKRKDDRRNNSISPDSSDSEFGAKTLMRKVRDYTRVIGEFGHKINDDSAETVTKDEISENPGKYFVANFRGDHLSYFGSNRERREYVKQSVSGLSKGESPDYKSIARGSIEKEFTKTPEKIPEEVSKLKIPANLSDVKVVKTYKSPQHFAKSVKDIGGSHGNPFISTSKDTKVTPQYADHSEGATATDPHPRYGFEKKSPRKPKHRLVGMQAVFVHEANEYLKTQKADIERLRHSKEIGKKNAVERENQEIIFGDQIAMKNVAGYVPLAYPNLGKDYDSSDEELFGLNLANKKPSLTRSTPVTMGATAKNTALYPAAREFQWKMAMRAVKEKNPDGELLWVDNKGSFRKFTPISNQKVVSDEFQAELLRKRNEKVGSEKHLAEVTMKLDDTLKVEEGAGGGGPKTNKLEETIKVKGKKQRPKRNDDEDDEQYLDLGGSGVEASLAKEKTKSSAKTKKTQQKTNNLAADLEAEEVSGVGAPSPERSPSPSPSSHKNNTTSLEGKSKKQTGRTAKSL